MHEEMGDRKPSYVVRHPKSLVPDDILRSILSSLLSSHIQDVLVGQAKGSLDLVSKLAYRISEVVPQPNTAHDVELALYADDTAIIAMSLQTSLIVKYLESYLRDLERWLREWRIAINVSKCTAMLLAKTSRIPKPQPVQFFGKAIHFVDTTRYLWVSLDTRLTWSTH